MPFICAAALDPKTPRQAALPLRAGTLGARSAQGKDMEKDQGQAHSWAMVPSAHFLRLGTLNSPTPFLNSSGWETFG